MGLARTSRAASASCSSARLLRASVLLPGAQTQPSATRSLGSALTQLPPTEDWGPCHLQGLSLRNLCSGSLGNLEKEAINYLPKIMQVVKRGTDPSSLQTPTMAQQELATLFCRVTSAVGLPHLHYSLPSTLYWDELY